MTKDELLGELYDKTLTGNGPAVLDLTNQGLGQGLGPETLLYEALIPALEEVGARFERGDFFVPEMLIAGKAMAGALEILRPLLAETGAETIGTVSSIDRVSSVRVETSLGRTCDSAGTRRTSSKVRPSCPNLRSSSSSR